MKHGTHKQHSPKGPMPNKHRHWWFGAGAKEAGLAAKAATLQSSSEGGPAAAAAASAASLSASSAKMGPVVQVSALVELNNCLATQDGVPVSAFHPEKTVELFSRSRRHPSVWIPPTKDV